MSTAAPLIVKDLAKSFAGVTVLRDISFTIEAPQVVALLGTNGAGKSTMMRTIAGFLPADAGNIQIGGISMEELPERAHHAMGYLPESAPTYTGFRVREALRFTAEAQGLRGKDARDAVEAAIRDCALETVADRICDQLSKGYHRRLGLAQALVHRPPLLMLDEPTDGLDPLQKNAARELLKNLGKKHAVLISTHLLEEVPMICDRVLMLQNGQITYDGPVPDDLEAKFSGI